MFVVNKPIFQSSNGYMRHIKRKYNTKKVGFSGTLDPFATGCLIVATGQYTKLFQYLNKTPKTYRATLWIGASSPSLDIENVESIKALMPIDKAKIVSAISSLKGNLTYLPPKYSAKKINGMRAYDLAREGLKVELKTITSTIYDIKLLNYNHPFISFESTVSEGTYIRSLGQMIASKLDIDATLSSLYRVNEGDFFYENQKPIDPFLHLSIPSNIYTGDDEYIELGKKLYIEYFENKKDGVYLIESANFYSIIQIDEEVVTYRFNRIPKFSDSSS